MPLQCPHCQISQAKENRTCINCGQPLTPAAAAPAAATLAAPAAVLGDPALLADAEAAALLAAQHHSPAADPVHIVQVQRDAWRLPALIVVGLILALVAAALRVAPRKPAGPAASPAAAQGPAAVPPVTAAVPPPSSAALPPAASVSLPASVAKSAGETSLTDGTHAAAVGLPAITLTSQSAGRHVRVGDDVTLTAFAQIAHGQSATLTLYYRRGHGRKTMVAFAQGSLCSTTWTPSIPGRYEFAATALDEHQQAAVSRHLDITVDRSALPTVARRLPTVVAARSPRPAAAAPAAATRPLHPAPPSAYHVAAAFFFYPRSAEVLADALNRRGYQAVPERMKGPQGKTVYVVVTGTYHRSAEARKEVLDLQRSGYQAYFFTSP